MEQERALFQKRVSPEIDYINAKREFDDAQTRANELNNLISSYGGSGNGTLKFEPQCQAQFYKCLVLLDQM
jgi:cobalt-zinc-cadmium efflux system membrane fusion protein